MTWIPAWHACEWRLVGPCRPSCGTLPDRSIPCANQDLRPSTTPSGLSHPTRGRAIRGPPIRPWGGLPVRRPGEQPVRLHPPRGPPIRWLGGPDVSRPAVERQPVAECAS